MFNTLLESRSSRQRIGKGGTASVIFHVVIGSLAVYATAIADTPEKAKAPDKLVFVDVKPGPNPPKVPTRPMVEPLENIAVTVEPIEFPDEFPQPEMTMPATDDGFKSPGVTTSTVTGGGRSTVDAEGAFSSNQVEKQAAAIPGTPTPRYPDMLTSAGIEGQVFVEFVVDTTGRADMSTFKVLRSDNEAFTDEVRGALPRMRFFSAEAGGRKVKELVQLPFTFALSRR
jgi:periplasmic protein TonB